MNVAAGRRTVQGAVLAFALMCALAGAASAEEIPDAALSELGSGDVSVVEAVVADASESGVSGGGEQDGATELDSSDSGEAQEGATDEESAPASDANETGAPESGEDETLTGVAPEEQDVEAEGAIATEGAGELETLAPQAVASVSSEKSTQSAAASSDISTQVSAPAANAGKAATIDVKASVTVKTAATTSTKKTSTSAKSASATTAAKTAAKAAPAPKKGKGDLAEGSYYIVSALTSGKVLDMAGASKSNGGNAQLYDVNGTGAQQWVVQIAKDGFAIIKNLCSGLVLDVAGAKNANGTNVQQYASNGTKAQKWTIKKYGNRYVIVSALNGNYVLDISGAKTANGSNFQIYKRNNSKAQQFSFVSTSPKAAKAGQKTVANGIYTIRPLASSSKVASVDGASKKSGGNALIYSNDAYNQSQAYRFTYDGKGYYTITNVNSGLKLAPAASCAVPGINVGQYNLGNVDRAKWVVTKKASGQYELRNKATNLVLDLAGAKDAEGTNLNLYGANNTKAQRYALKSLSTLSAGVVAFMPAANLGLSMDVVGAGEAAGAKLQAYSANGSFAQKFRVAKSGKGFTIQAMNSGLYLTGAADGALTTQKAKSKYAGQVWLPQTSGGYLVLKNATTGKVVDLKGGKTSSGAGLQTYKANGTKAQNFIVRNTEVLSDGMYNIALLANTQKVVSVQNGDRRNYANVRVLGSNGYNAQKFFISSAGDGTYSILNPITGRAVGVAGGSKNSGANVDMYTYGGSKSQKWKVRVNADCSLTFVNANSGKVLDVAGGAAKDGTNIQVYNSNGSQAQKFRLRTTTWNYSESVSLNVPCYNQNPQLPTGCESVALTNALRYWGFSLSKTTMANRMPRGSDGVYNFIGNPYDQSGWIICAPGITNMANSYLKDKKSDLRAHNVTGTSLKDLRKYLDKGEPVVVWTTIGMGEPVGLTYRHGYPLRGSNHAVVLSGYNPKTGQYRVADSLAGTVWRSGSSFGNLYNKMGKQAVVIY